MSGLRSNRLLFRSLYQFFPIAARIWPVAVIAGILTLAPTFYMMEVYSRVISSRSGITLVMLTLLVLGIYVFMEALNFVVHKVMQAASHAFDETLSDRVFNAIFSAKLAQAVGGGMQPLADLRTIREFFYSPAMIAMMEVPVALVSLAIMFYISPVLGYFSIFGALIQLVLAILTEKKVQPPLVESSIAAIAAQGFAANCHRNAEVIQAMGMLAGVHGRWMGLQHRFLYLQARASDAAGALMTASKSIMLIQGSAGLGLGFWLMTQGHVAHGGLALLGSIVGGKVLQPLVQVVSHWRSVVEARESLARLDELLGELEISAPKMELPAPKGHLVVENLSTGAPGNPVPIIRSLSFALEPGECLAVIGPSASGKTTLARALMGLWPALSGKIRIDGADVHSWSKSDLGPYLGYMPQEVELFDGSLADNISRFSPRNDMALSKAITATGLSPLLEVLPNGIDTHLGFNGVYLSGGQRQRVGLARAVYGQPRFVVLDEPNSSLDEDGERQLLAMLFELKSQGTAIVVITHRKSLLPAVDKIMVLRDGSAQLYGPRDAVLSSLQAPNGAGVAGAAS